MLWDETGGCLPKCNMFEHIWHCNERVKEEEEEKTRCVVWGMCVYVCVLYVCMCVCGICVWVYMCVCVCMCVWCVWCVCDVCVVCVCGVCVVCVWLLESKWNIN